VPSLEEVKENFSDVKKKLGKRRGRAETITHEDHPLRVQFRWFPGQSNVEIKNTSNQEIAYLLYDSDPRNDLYLHRQRLAAGKTEVIILPWCFGYDKSLLLYIAKPKQCFCASES
jgi:hypothetical protein